jgi:hypothetical protein
MAEKTVEMDEAFFNRVNTYLLDIPPKLRIFVVPIFLKFVDPTNQRLFALRKHLTAAQITQQQQAKLMHGF